MTHDSDKDDLSILHRKLRRRNLGASLIISGLLGVVVSFIYPGVPTSVLYVSQAIFVLGVILGLSVGHPRCPHCGKHFFMRWLGRFPLGPSNILAVKCMNCGRGANDPDM